MFDRKNRKFQLNLSKQFLHKLYFLSKLKLLNPMSIAQDWFKSPSINSIFYHCLFNKKHFEIGNPVTLTHFPKAVEQRGENCARIIFFDNLIKNLVKSCRQIFFCQVTRRVIVLFSVVTQSILKLFEVKVKVCLLFTSNLRRYFHFGPNFQLFNVKKLRIIISNIFWWYDQSPKWKYLLKLSPPLKVLEFCLMKVDFFLDFQIWPQITSAWIVLQKISSRYRRFQKYDRFFFLLSFKKEGFFSGSDLWMFRGTSQLCCLPFFPACCPFARPPKSAAASQWSQSNFGNCINSYHDIPYVHHYKLLSIWSCSRL